MRPGPGVMRTRARVHDWVSRYPQKTHQAQDGNGQHVDHPQRVDGITASEPSVRGGELDPEDTAKISRPEANGLVSWVELFNP